MSQPIHTPGPVEVEIKPERAPDGMQFRDCYITSAAKGFYSGRIIADTFNADSAFTEEDRQANARLLAAAYNVFDSAAITLGCNAVELAEAMQDGALLAEVLDSSELILHHTPHLDRTAFENVKALLAKVKGGAS